MAGANFAYAPAALIGRDGDSQAIVELLADYPLVTLVGPGGVGKTTLAMQVASMCADQFDGGAFVAELAGTSDHDDVGGLVARQLDASSIEALRLRAAGQRTLVVLDNCESALAASRMIADELIGDSEIRVVATSRSPLYAIGERLVPVRPLSVAPEADHSVDRPVLSAAEELFIRRAQESGATWQHTPENLHAVRQLTKQLNGLPLAIELAAARSRVLGPSELFELLDRQLDLLVRPGASQERHHSLRSVIETSYQPLAAALQHFLRSVAIMSAPFDLRLAHAVAGTQGSDLESLDLISQLVEASLIDVRETEAGKTEYLLLDSIRAYGREQLAETSELDLTGERYADAVTAVAGEIVSAALESFSPDVLGAIRERFSHLVNAISWCLEHDPSPARTYQMFLLFFGPTGASAEIADLAMRVRDAWSDPAPLQAEAFAVMGSLIFRTGRHKDGAELAAQAVAHPDATAMAKLMGLRTMGYAAAVDRDNKTAVEHIDAALELGPAFSASFDREIRVSRALMVWDPQDSPQALDMVRNVLSDAIDNQEWVIVVFASTTMANHHRLLGDMDEALRSAEAAVAAADDSEMAWAIISAEYVLASLKALEQGWTSSLPHFRRAFETTIAVGDIDGCAKVVRSAAGAAKYNGHDALALDLCATSPPRPGVAIPPPPFDSLEQQLVADVASRPPMSSDERVRIARELLAEAAHSVDQPAGETTPELVTGPTVRFGDYELDSDMCELRCAGERVAIEPQVYDVLLYLIERRGSVVSKHELLDEVWGDRFVSEGTLSSRIAAVRRATGDSGKEQRIIRTVHGKGFSFVADVVAVSNG